MLEEKAGDAVEGILVEIVKYLPVSEHVKETVDQTSFAVTIAEGIRDANVVKLLFELNKQIYTKGAAPQLIEIGNDPPTADFTAVVQPASIDLSSLPTTGNATLDALFGKNRVDALRSQSFLEAVNATYDRYTAAYNAGDSKSALLQIEALLNFMHLYDGAAADCGADLVALRAALQRTGMVDQPYDPQAFASLQANVSANGVPQPITQALLNAGLTQQEIDAGTQAFLTADGSQGSGTAFGSVTAAASALQQTSTLPPNGLNKDFNGDRFADFLLSNPSARKSAVWNLQGTTLLTGVYGPSLPAGWTLVRAADFNGDRELDLILFNPATRQTAVWYLNDIVFVSGAYGPTLPVGWKLIGIADFDADGHPDYVLFNASTRQTAIWFLNGTALSHGAYGPTLPMGWSLADANDFNADGKPDFVLTNTSLRQTAIWYLNGTAFSSGAFGPTLPVGWTSPRTADFNLAGKPDYALFNPTTRQTAVWFLNGTSYISGALGPTLPAGWALISP